MHYIMKTYKRFLSIWHSAQVSKDHLREAATYERKVDSITNADEKHVPIIPLRTWYAFFPLVVISSIMSR